MTTTDTDPTSPALRPLGAFEQVIDLYASRNPVQFSLVLELSEPASSVALEQALVQLQRTHPLLAVCIDRTGDRPLFRASSAPVPLRCVPEDDWRRVAADEQARPIDLDTSPLARAVLLTSSNGDSGTVVLLTFSHQISDGRGALLAGHDLVAHLGDEGRAPRPVPLDQENLLRQLPEPDREDDEPEWVAARSVEPEQAAASTRPFDGAPPHVESAALGAVRTAQLRAAARQHGSTVQGVLCAVAAEALSSGAGERRVRINAPVDLRSSLDLEDDVVNRFTATTVVLSTGRGSTTWDLARDATEQLRAARRSARDTALALASLDPGDALEAEAAMLAATSSDLEITNLGSAEPSPSVVAIWGPTMTTQVRDERILGVVTHAGALRMTLTSHDHPAGLAADLLSRLERL